jgi:hypothetical protein
MKGECGRRGESGCIYIYKYILISACFMWVVQCARGGGFMWVVQCARGGGVLYKMIAFKSAMFM